MSSRICKLILFLPLVIAAERRVVTPAGAPPPVGPYSPGIWAGDYLYVSGQGARDGQNQLPATPEEQAAQCIANVKAVVGAAGLTMDNVVYLQMYLANLQDRPALDRVLAQTWNQSLPAHSLVGVTRMPTGTPVEISAVAFRTKERVEGKSSITITPDRFYLSGISGSTIRQITAKLGHAVLPGTALAITAYHITEIDGSALEQALNKQAGGAVTAVAVAALPGKAKIEVTGILTRTLKSRRTSGPCTAANGTIYCAANSGTDPGPLLDELNRNLQALGGSLAQAVVSHVYLDNLDDFPAMNKVYATRFPAPFPTRTTVQPAATKGQPAPAVRISVIAAGS